MVRILLNAKSNNGTGTEAGKEIEKLLPGETFEYVDITAIEDAYGYVESAPEDVKLVICGGDGTLQHFANDVHNRPLHRDVFFFPAGSGNDFWNDVKNGVKDELLLINPYVEKLPVTIVDGKEYCFVNGVGYGIDGYCCEEGDKQRAISDKPINYTAIAIKGLLFKFKPRNVKVTVDGKVYEYKKAWLAPVMNGKFYGGGMKVAPDQDRLNKERTLTCVVMHNLWPLHALMIFPKIFKGELVNEKKHVVVLTGKDITVEFDKPCAMQIDGETFLNIASTESHSYKE